MFRRRGGFGGIVELAYVLALIGGILLILLNVAAVLGFAFTIPFHSPVAGYGFGAFIGIILGIIAVIGSKRLPDLVWSVVLLIVGWLAGGIGGLLVLIGGLLGIVARFI